MKTIAVKHVYPIWSLIFLIAILGAINFFGFYYENIGIIIAAIITTVVSIIFLVYEYILQKKILISSNDDGIIINGVLKKRYFKWSDIGYIDFKRYHNRYYSFEFGKLLIRIPENKTLKINNVANVKNAYDKLISAKREHYENINN